jgi:dihydrofolate reductase
VRSSLGITTWHIFGHSWGGLLAQLYARAYHDRVRSLFLSSPSLGVGTDRRQSSPLSFLALGRWPILLTAANLFRRVWRNYFPHPRQAPSVDAAWLRGVNGWAMAATADALARAAGSCLPSAADRERAIGHYLWQSSLQKEAEPDVKLTGELHRDHRPSFRCDERKAMLIYSMGVSVDGFIADRAGAFGWAAPDEELFRFHLAQVRELGGFLCGRRLYETMLVWETDPSLRATELEAAFADVWCALPKVVFSRTLDRVQGNARLAEASLAEEAAAALDATDKDVEIGGAGLAAAAIELGLVDELRMFRNPVVVGGGTPFLPPVTEAIRLDLVETRTFGSRVIYERYRRARDESD